MTNFHGLEKMRFPGRLRSVANVITMIYIIAAVNSNLIYLHETARSKLNLETSKRKIVTKIIISFLYIFGTF